MLNFNRKTATLVPGLVAAPPGEVANWARPEPGKLISNFVRKWFLKWFLKDKLKCEIQ